jgi:dipeptidyl aminopeptidase/acylaminoacyl peptidase
MRTVSGPQAATPGSGWGGDDVADIAAVVRATLDAHPELDPDRVGVMGGSYGGLLTVHLLAQTDLFRAGWAERGPYNLFSDAGTKDEAPWFFEAYLGTSHLEDPVSYWQASPLRLVQQITAPLAIVHSEEDRRCSIGQAEELFFALKRLDREVEFIRFPGECHELTRSGSPVHRLQRLEILLEWFGRWLSP